MADEIISGQKNPDIMRRLETGTASLKGWACGDSGCDWYVKGNLTRAQVSERYREHVLAEHPRRAELRMIFTANPTRKRRAAQKKWKERSMGPAGRSQRRADWLRLR
ncbi:MAG: hypothetical protein ABH867_02980 [Patescibacteria group bacterium]|nr:hypothetical protein [Patescibacteria group bacterium]